MTDAPPVDFAAWFRGAPARPGRLRVLFESRAVVAAGEGWRVVAAWECGDRAGVGDEIGALAAPDEPCVLRAHVEHLHVDRGPMVATSDWLCDAAVGAPVEVRSLEADRVLGRFGFGRGSLLDLWESGGYGPLTLMLAALVGVEKGPVLRAAAACVEEASGAVGERHAPAPVRVALANVRRVAAAREALTWERLPPGDAREEARRAEEYVLGAWVVQAAAHAQQAIDRLHARLDPPQRSAGNVLLGAACTLALSAGDLSVADFATRVRYVLESAADAVALAEADRGGRDRIKQFRADQCPIIRREVATLAVLRAAAGVSRVAVGL